MTVELAEFGVIVRTIPPGISATRIFKDRPGRQHP
jgi:hypothetical protein